MQTFIPYSSFKASAKVLDSKRLLKQRVEVYQILNVLVNNKKAWSNHPAVLQWKGFENALCQYGNEICIESTDRGYNDNLREKIMAFENTLVDCDLPPWFGRKDIHDSHKSRLKFKGRVDALMTALKKHFLFKKNDDWLDSRGFSTKNALKYDEMLILEGYAKTLNIEVCAGFYSVLWPDVPDNQEYVWPKLS